MRFKPRYIQLTIDGFRSSLDGLDKKNRWVWMGDHLPWDEYKKLYSQTLNNKTVGASAKPARMVIVVMLVKHITRLSDVDTIEMIRENPYMQYLCGLEELTDQPIFDASLFENTCVYQALRATPSCKMSYRSISLPYCKPDNLSIT